MITEPALGACSVKCVDSFTVELPAASMSYKHRMNDLNRGDNSDSGKSLKCSFFVTIIILALLLFIFKVELVRCYISVHSYVICNARVQQGTSCLLELSNFLRIVHRFHPLVYNELQLRWRRKLPMMNREL